MTLSELRDKLNAIVKQYREQSKDLTSIQYERFKKNFSRSHGVKLDSYSISIENVTINDVCPIEDVRKLDERIRGFLGFNTVYYYVITVDYNDQYPPFGFTVQNKSGLEKLNKGQMIHINGKVTIHLSWYDGDYITLCESERYSIKFSKI